MALDVTTDEAVQVLLAKQAIRDALYRYCRGEDRTDIELSRSLWHADGTASYGKDGQLFNGPISQWQQNGLKEYMGSSHQVTNVVIEVDGDRALSEAYVTVRLWKMSDEGGEIWQRITVGRYLDEWSCRSGVWAVDHRRFVFDLSYSHRVPQGDQDKVWERNREWFEGRQGPKDPSYELFGSAAAPAE